MKVFYTTWISRTHCKSPNHFFTPYALNIGPIRPTTTYPHEEEHIWPILRMNTSLFGTKDSTSAHSYGTPRPTCTILIIHRSLSIPHLHIRHQGGPPPSIIGSASLLPGNTRHSPRWLGWGSTNWTQQLEGENQWREPHQLSGHDAGETSGSQTRHWVWSRTPGRRTPPSRTSNMASNLGHLNFSKVNILALLGITSNRLASTNPPKCEGCIYGAMNKLPWSTKGKHSNAIQKVTVPVQCISVDQLKSLLPVFLAHLKGRLTKQWYIAETVFVGHFIRMSYLHLYSNQTSEMT